MARDGNGSWSNATGTWAEGRLSPPVPGFWLPLSSLSPIPVPTEACTVAGRGREPPRRGPEASRPDARRVACHGCCGPRPSNARGSEPPGPCIPRRPREECSLTSSMCFPTAARVAVGSAGRRRRRGTGGDSQGHRHSRVLCWLLLPFASFTFRASQ